MRSFTHEWTHYLDVIAGNSDGGESISGKDDKLQRAIADNDGMSMSDAVKNNFKAYQDGYKQIKDKYDRLTKEAPNKVAGELFGEDRPSWLKEDGSVDMYRYWTDYDAIKRFQKAVDKEKKAIINERRRECRSYMDGSVCLQGIYDALSMGEFREKGITKYGHSKRYYHADKENPAMEVLADYMALKATNPKLAKLFIDDKPEIASALDEVALKITKKLRGME